MRSTRCSGKEKYKMLSKLLTNYEETAAVILFCIGFSTMLLN